MAKLIIDTCSWLDLAKPKFSEVFDELKKQVDEGRTVLLTSEIIVEEWERNKDKILEEIIQSIRAHAKSAMKMAELLDEDSGKELSGIIEKYQTKQEAQEKIAKKYFEKVEGLLKKAKVYPISDGLKLRMVDRALKKEAPFHNSKNNMADALLYFGAIEYVDKEAEIATDLFFVTLNHKEFCDAKDSTKLHPDLEKRNVHFYNNLAHALKMRKELVDEMDEYHEYQFWSWIDMQAEIARGK